MNLLVLFFFTLLLSCSHSPNSQIPQKNSRESEKLFQDSCHQIDTHLEDVWILLCQKDPHSQRAEIYEYSQIYGTFKRLTFQDGLISDILVKNIDEIVYVSNYDESKEQFLKVLKGENPGTDLYLKKRNGTSFQRLTQLRGVEFHPFWDSSSKKLYFAHEFQKKFNIMSLNSDDKIETYVTSESKINFPIVVSGDLYWLESSPDFKKSYLMKSGKKKVFASESQIIKMKPGRSSEEILFAFATGLGTEIWSLRLKPFCWKSLIKSEKRSSDFNELSGKELLVSYERKMEKMSRLENSLDCEPSPPGLGVEVLK